MTPTQQAEAILEPQIAERQGAVEPRAGRKNKLIKCDGLRADLDDARLRNMPDDAWIDQLWGG